jgi:hypothetical protein
MNLAELNKVAAALTAPGKGILAADESSGTIKKRFDAIGVESTADSRRDYRELLFRSTEAMSVSCRVSGGQPLQTTRTGYMRSAPNPSAQKRRAAATSA